MTVPQENLDPDPRPGDYVAIPDREPPRISVALNAFGGASVVISILFLGGSFYIDNEIGKAFCLGAFFSGMLGSILLFGFAKVIDLLDAIRIQTIIDAHERAERRRMSAADIQKGP